MSGGHIILVRSASRGLHFHWDSLKSDQYRAREQLMQREKHSHSLDPVSVAMTIVVILGFVLVPGAWSASKVKVLHTFNVNGVDGYQSKANLVFDKAGNLFGTTFSGGAYGAGTVFQLTPEADGTWSETVLHSFGRASDGANPDAGLVFDAAGNLYGTTLLGGNSTCYGCGTVFQLTPATNGTWTETIIHAFCRVQDCADGDGENPKAGL